MMEYARGLLVMEIGREREGGREEEREVEGGERAKQSSGATLGWSDPPRCTFHAHFTINTFEL